MKTLEPVAHLVPEIKELCENKQWDVLKDILEDVRPEDVAESWYRFSDDEKIGIFKLLGPQAALVFFENLEVGDQTYLLKSLDERNIAPLLEGIPASDVAELFHTLPKRVVKRMKSLVRKKDAMQRIELLMKFEPETAGALLQPEFIRLTPRMTARAALSMIQSIGRTQRRKHLSALYVTDSEGSLLGMLSLQDLVVAVADLPLGELMVSAEYFKLTPGLDQERVASIFAKYDLVSAPVVDANNKLLGVIFVDDIIDVIRSEASEDIAKMAGTQPEEFEERSLLRIAWFRFPWLLATLGGQFVVFSVIRHFEFAIVEVLALASFLPLVPAMAGNIGSQSAMILVRNLATGQLRGAAKYAALVKEVSIGVMLGLVYGLMTGAIAWLFYGQIVGPRLPLVIMLSVWAAMTASTAAGAIGPVILERLGVDPATAMGPLVTTLSDIMAISIYFSLATLLLVRGVL
ncbi:MAG: magnesium transporter [Candidatus Omnitrophica bacterium]|nr:magnesium transporter [Candidatus Omnitrophota bacterium]